MKKLRRDGVALSYEEAGSGPPLLFIHGWACDHSYFAPQIEHFGHRHRVIAVDLRGHGDSDAPRQDYAMSAMAGDVTWLCEQLDVRQPVVIGHSMGGLIALDLGHVTAAIVALDSPLVLPPERLQRLRSAGAGLRGANYRDVARRLVEGMFAQADDQQRRAWIIEHMTQRPQHVLASAWEQLFACANASAETAAAIPVPLLAIASAGGHMADLARLRQLCPRLITGQTVGAGHFHQLEVPDQVNAMVERFLAVSVP